MCQNNCNVYGVENIQFIAGNFLELYSSIRTDIVVLSPPWGGPKYLDVSDEDALKLKNIITVPCNGEQLFKHGYESTLPGGITVYMLPKNVDKQSVIDVAKKLKGTIEIEDIYVNNVLKMTIAYIHK